MARPRVPESTRRLLNDAAGSIAALLPAGWSSRVVKRSPEGGIVSVESPRDEGVLAVWVRDRLNPRDVPGLDPPTQPTVVASQWLSPRTQELLRERGLGFIDATGNAEITIDDPGLFIRATGARRDPRPRPGRALNLRGPKTWALLRTLVEVVPPYGVTDLAEAVGVDAGYVSRILRALEDELLIERQPRGPVTAVAWESVLRRMAATYSLFDANDATTWVAPGGAGQLLDDLAGKNVGQWAVTGSFAAATIAPVAAPEIAVVYTTDPERIARAGRLLPATSGANVLLAEPYDPIVFQRTRRSDTMILVSTTQIAVDCLSGPGRMPEEGEALISWMRRDALRWQVTSPARGGAG